MFLELDFSLFDKNEISYPKEDFISNQFDANYNSETENMIVILGTQRSGSTLLCDLIRSSCLCVPHEYFQPFGYMQTLAHRWGCRQGDGLNFLKYVKSLERWRTGKTGWIGINIHALHLPLFKTALRFFEANNIYFFHLIRGDLISQAISYEIASQTGKWSSHYSNNRKAKYNYDGIKSKISAIQVWNLEINRFLAESCVEVNYIIYEDVVKDIKNIYHKLNDIGANIKKINMPTIEKQSNQLNSDWKRRFLKDTSDFGFK